MREIGCLPFLRKENVGIAEYWLCKVEQSLAQIPIPENVQVSCVTQKLSNSARSWWTMVRERWEVLTWGNFKSEFKRRYYSRQIVEIKNMPSWHQDKVTWQCWTMIDDSRTSLCLLLLWCRLYSIRLIDWEMDSDMSSKKDWLPYNLKL
jgi:hypothetical protein